MEPILKASGVTFSYGDEPVLRGIDLSLFAGQIVALLGPNGSGKSTLIKTLIGHLRAEGKIEWDGRAIGKWGRREMARKVAYLPQSPVYGEDQMVWEVLGLGRSPYWSAFGVESAKDWEIVRAVSKRVGLNDLLNRRMDQLSGGQRQRVFVGRCLVQEPAAMLLDEPNTFLDLRYQVELCELVRKLAKEQSIGVLMASHDLNLATAVADRVVVLDGGVVSAAGPVAVLREEHLSKVYGVRMTRLQRSDGGPVFMPEMSGPGAAPSVGG
jgi:iron complex transport system ATP-binding protein